MLDREILVSEEPPVDAPSPGPVVVQVVSPLKSEPLNNPVDLAATVTLPIRSVGVGEGDEVADSFGAGPPEQPESYVADHFLAESDLHGNLGSYGPVRSFNGDLPSVYSDRVGQVLLFLLGVLSVFVNFRFVFCILIRDLLDLRFVVVTSRERHQAADQKQQKNVPNSHC